MDKRCEFMEAASAERCPGQAAWIADVGWIKGAEGAPSADYVGTSWAVVLCDPHYQLLLAAGRITGTAHPIAPNPS